MTEKRTCPQCGAERTDVSLSGLCRRCLARFSFFELEGKANAAKPSQNSDQIVSVTHKSEFETEHEGILIGRYKLLEKLGEGGFGVVYMAEQQEPVRRRVALKIIKLGMDTKEVVARFEAERQALATMDHPNIASVFDGGATDTGRPFFVMELVKGVPITDYCDANKLSTAQRLELFMQVCHAVQHAHQKGIIHRDLKPSNILVTVKDDQPLPKIIDFGVAKATQARLTEKTLFTRLEQWIGTPAYMSPEQTGLGSLDVDTRSDVYSLGVLLYELLTGRTPFDARKLLDKGYGAVMRTIREEEPPKPSTRLSTLSREELLAVAAKRQAEPAKLNRQVHGDLDWIVMKALEKDRRRRYESASGLAKDLECHLNQEPVSAGAPSAGYRIWKLVQRHKLVFAACAAVGAAVLIGGVVSAWLAWRANRFAGEALRQKEVATHETARARALSRQSEKDRQRIEFDLYCSQISLAIGAWRAGDLERARQALDACPKQDRNWEWFYLKHLCNREGTVIRSGVGSRWDEELDTYGRLSVTPDGRRLCVVALNAAAASFDAYSGRQVDSLGNAAHWPPSTSRDLALREPNAEGMFSPDGRWWIRAPDRNNPPRVFDVKTGELLSAVKAIDRSPPPQLATLDSIQFESRSFAGGIVLNGDGTSLAIGTTNGVAICGLPDGDVQTEIRFPNVKAVPIAFSPDDTALLIGCTPRNRSAELKLMRLADSTPILSIPRPRSRDAVRHVGIGYYEEGGGFTNVGAASRFRVCELVRFSPNGDLLALVQAAPQGNRCIVEVWDVPKATLRFQRSLKMLPSQVAYVPSSRNLIVSGVAKDEPSSEADLVMIDAEGGAVMRESHLDNGLLYRDRYKLFDGWSMFTETGDLYGCLDFAVSPNGRLIAAACMDHLVHLIDLENFRELNTLRGHSAGVSQVRFSPDGQRCYSLDTSGEVRAWNVEQPEEAPRILLGNSGVAQKAASADLFAYNSIDLFRPTRVQVVSFENNTVRVLPQGPAAADFVLSPDGSVLASIIPPLWPFRAVAEQGSRASQPKHRLIVMQDVQSGLQLRRFHAPVGEILEIAFSPDGKRLGAICGEESSSAEVLVVWDVTSGELLPTRVSLTAFPSTVEVPNMNRWRTQFGSGMLAFSRDSTRVAVVSKLGEGTRDGLVTVHPVSDAQGEPATLCRVQGFFPIVFNSADDSLLTRKAIESGGRLKLRWQVIAPDSGQVLKSFPSGYFDEDRHLLRVSSDGTQFACLDGSGRLEVFNVLTGRPTLNAQPFGSAASLPLSNDGKRLVSVTRSGQLQLWDLDHAVPVCTLPVSVAMAFFSTDGHRLVTVSREGKIALLDGAPYPEQPDAR